MIVNPARLMRGAVVLIHLTVPAAVERARINAIIPAPAMELFFDASRSIVDIVTAGVFKRHGNIRFIVTYTGAALPILTKRIDLILPLLSESLREGMFGQNAQRLFLRVG